MSSKTGREGENYFATREEEKTSEGVLCAVHIDDPFRATRQIQTSMNGRSVNARLNEEEWKRTKKKEDE